MGSTPTCTSFRSPPRTPRWSPRTSRCYWNASSVGGSKHEIVLDSVAQEIDIKTGLVLFQWDSLDHVPLGYSYTAHPDQAGHPYDYFHINSIQRDSDGSLSSPLATPGPCTRSPPDRVDDLGAGGKHSSFKMGKNTQFAFQHDARLVPGNRHDLRRRRRSPGGAHGSRALTLSLDTPT